MRYKVFLDTNVLLSGIFFEGNESRILDFIEIEFVTSEDVVDELFAVIKKKFSISGKEPLKSPLPKPNMH